MTILAIIQDHIITPKNHKL